MDNNPFVESVRSEPTMMLRFLNDGTIRKLQQRWILRHYRGSILQSVTNEWIDVPMVNLADAEN